MSDEHEEGTEEAKDIEIHIGGNDSVPPTDPKAQRLRSWANIIATTAALLTGVAAIVRPQDQTVNRNTYDQLKASIEQTNAAVKKDHDDMVALHNYLSGYFAGNATIVLPPLSSSSSPPSPVPAPSTRRQAQANPPAPAPTITFGILPAPAPPAAPFPLPPVSSVTSAVPLPEFDSVAAKK